MQVGLFKIRKVPSLLFDSFFPVDCGIGCAIGSWFSALPVTSSLELLQVEEEQDADSAHFVVASRTDFDPALTCPDLKCDDGRIYEFSSAVLQTEMFHEETNRYRTIEATNCCGRGTPKDNMVDTKKWFPRAQTFRLEFAF